jgi:hypothetical protein
MKLRNALAAYKRIAITGAPGTGKTSYSNQVTDRPVIHTDDWMTQPWDEVPLLVKAKCDETPDAFIVEGVQVPRTLRKGLEVDAVLYLSKPLEPQTPAQIALGKGLTTTLSEWAQTHPNVPILTDITLDACDMKRRYLTFTLDSEGVTPTPQGGRRYPAKATRSTVAKYNRNGQIVREFRPADEIKKAIATLKGAPVVLLHPDENGGEVDTENIKRLSCGHFEDPTWDDAEQCARGFVVVNDGPSIQTLDVWASETGGVDISCGYDNARIEEPGVSPDGEEYDVIQTDYVFNHVALGPRGWGRLGPDVGLTLDCNDHEVLMKFTTKDSADVTKPDDKGVTKDEAGLPGPSPDAGGFTPEEIAGLKALAKMAPAITQMLNSGAAPAAPVSLDAPPPAPAAPVAAAPGATPPEPEKKTLDHKDIERIAEQAAQEGAEVRTEAVRLLGSDYSFKGKSTRQVRLDVVRSLDSNFDEKAADPVLKAVYDTTLKALEKQAEFTRQLGETRALDFAFTADSGSTDNQVKPIGHDIYTA